MNISIVDLEQPSAVVPRVLLALHSKSRDGFQDRKGVYQKGTRETPTSAEPVSQPEKHKFEESVERILMDLCFRNSWHKMY